MKKLLLLLSLVVVGYTPQDTATLRKEKIEKYYYSENQALLQKILAALNREVYVEMYVNGAQYTEIADRPTWSDAELVAMLPRSHTIRKIRPCPCQRKTVVRMSYT